MEKKASEKLPLHLHGIDWSRRDVECAKEWFATSHIKEAVLVAFVQLKLRGYPRFDLAEDSFSEWLCGRVASEDGLLPPRFSRAVRHFNPELGELKAFLFEDLRRYISGTVVKRLALESRIDPIEEIPVPDPRSNIPLLVSIRELTLKVLDSLDERDRRILTLSNEGHSTIEIASITGTTVNAVKTAICRARSQAREELDRLGYARSQLVKPSPGQKNPNAQG